MDLFEFAQRGLIAGELDQVAGLEKLAQQLAMRREGRGGIVLHQAQEFIGGAAGGRRMKALAKVGADDLGDEDGVGHRLGLIEQRARLGQLVERLVKGRLGLSWRAGRFANQCQSKNQQDESGPRQDPEPEPRESEKEEGRADVLDVFLRAQAHRS